MESRTYNTDKKVQDLGGPGKLGTLKRRVYERQVKMTSFTKTEIRSIDDLDE